MPAAFAHFVPEQLDKTLLAEADGETAGFVSYELETGEITDIWVAPTVQNQGIGAVLLAGAESALKSAGQTATWLTTHIDNRSAMRFYRTHGYGFIATSDADSESLPDVRYTRAHLAKQLSRPNAARAETMAEVRRGIDTLDQIIVSLLEERYAFIDRAADLKPDLKLPARVPNRVEEVVRNAKKSAAAIGFDPELTEQLWRLMIDLAILREEQTMGPDEARAPKKVAS